MAAEFGQNDVGRDDDAKGQRRCARRQNPRCFEINPSVVPGGSERQKIFRGVIPTVGLRKIHFPDAARMSRFCREITLATGETT
jgi:hypothetical protein